MSDGKKGGARRTNRAPKKGGGWGERFLAALAKTANVTDAARRAGVGRQTAYDRRASDAAFARAWDDALEEAVERLELTARRRAERQSDTLLIFLLKAHRPEKYRERYDHRLAGPNGGPLAAEVKHDHRLDLAPYADAFRDFARGVCGEGGGGGPPVHTNGTPQPVHPPRP